MNNRSSNSSYLADQSSLIRKDEGELSRYFSVVRFCNFCGHSMMDSRSFIVEYWRAEESVHFCWCHSCGNRWELAEVTNITTTELEGGNEDF